MSDQIMNKEEARLLTHSIKTRLYTLKDIYKTAKENGTLLPPGQFLKDLADLNNRLSALSDIACLPGYESDFSAKHRAAIVHISKQLQAYGKIIEIFFGDEEAE
jgi:hypothetical protein